MQQVGTVHDPEPDTIELDLEGAHQSGSKLRVVGELDRNALWALPILRMSKATPVRKACGLELSSREGAEIRDSQIDIERRSRLRAVDLK